MAHLDSPQNASPLNGAARPRGSAGFTLLELMIVVVIIGVLATIAYASFTRNVVETRRKAATACLQEGAQFMERWYTTRLTYEGGSPTPACETDLAPFYRFDPPPVATATAYTLTAEPLNQQAARDTLCGTLSITQTGARTESGTATAITQCW